jgi:hypothetical protein
MVVVGDMFVVREKSARSISTREEKNLNFSLIPQENLFSVWTLSCGSDVDTNGTVARMAMTKKRVTS